jgi:mannose-6-phosphate isomerase-like protein (cupin superfamily)
MADYSVKKVSEMEGSFGGAMKKARAELGVSSFGMAVIQFPPGATQYPEHDHSHDGQEEVYFVLDGAGEVQVDGEAIPLEPETVVRVGPGTRRKIVTGDQPLRVLALGGVPGRAYAAPEWSELGGGSPPRPAQGDTAG